MELKTAESNNKSRLTNTGIEIQALNISIECMLFQLIDNELDIDWIESVLYLTQQQKICLKTAIELDVSQVSELTVSLLAYNRAVEAMCLKLIAEGEILSNIAEAVATLSRKQQPLIERLICTIADL